MNETLTDYITGKPVKSAKKEHVYAVNVFARKLVEELGYSKKQIQTLPQFRVKVSPSGKEKYPVDIVVFNDDRKTYDNVYMLVECKQPGRDDGRRQLEIYLNLVPSVQLGIWFNGKEHLYLRKAQDLETKQWEWVEIPELPVKGQRIEDIGLYKRKDLEKPKNLKRIFNDIRNHLVGMTTGITRDEAIAQEIINLLFCKIYDELNTPPESQVRFRVGIDEPASEVRDRIKKLFREAKREYKGVFCLTEGINLDDSSLAYVIGELQRFTLIEAERDALSEAFEVFIGPALRGTEGQFFTPRNVVRTAIKMLDPKVNEYVIEPACGSGGFLISIVEHMWRQLDEEAKEKGWPKEYLISKKKDVVSQYIVGIEKDSFLAKVAKAYMALIGDGKGGIFCDNSLERPMDWDKRLQQRVQLGAFDVLVTNPPFGAKIPVKGPRILSQYDLSFKWKFDKQLKKYKKTSKMHKSRPPQLLFIERCLQLVKPGGRLGLILPDGILGNPTDRYIREFILDKAKVLAVIDMPIETFLPSTGTKTSFLYLQKKHEDEKEDNYPIFMAIAKACGHNRRGAPIDEDDFGAIANNYRLFKEHRLTSALQDHLGFVVNISHIIESDYILVPRYFNLDIHLKLRALRNKGYKLISIKELIQKGILSIKRGLEIGSENYGSGDIPFVRTSDISNWEIRVNEETSVHKDVYELYKDKMDLQLSDILFVNDGGRMIGEIAIITEFDSQELLIQSHIRRIRVNENNDELYLDPYLLLYYLKHPVVKEQISSKVFVQATIPTLGNRLEEVILPVLKDKEKAKEVSSFIKQKIYERAKARKELTELF